RLMTENLRKARATDIYICSGKPQGETFQPRFTFHGFQYVEVSGLTSPPTLESVTGLVLHSDTPRVSSFSCSDSMVNRLFQNVVWTQRANFLDLPTDCPQRDERMGWTGDAQAYVATAAYNADIGAFYTKWLRELMESQRPSGTFPGYAPFPFQHGWDFGTAWADAGVICPWTIWQAYGDTRVIEACWEPMVRFMQWRTQTSQDNLGIAHGNAWGDWLAQGASTPLEYVDTIYFAISARLMSEMAAAIGHNEQSQQYAAQFERIKSAFATKYLNEDGSVNVNTQTAQALALFADLIPAEKREATGRHLAAMIAANGNHMSTGFLGTRPLLPVLSATGQNDLAVFLLQSREFPSWGYEITNGATTIWERWDSYTKEDGFGRHNASMNSFSHYAFGAVCEWMFRTLAGIDSGTPGYGQIIIAPHPAAPGSNGMHDPIQWVEASYDSIRGTIASNWKIADGKLMLSIDVPANTTAEVHVPAPSAQSITESGHPLDQADHVRVVRQEGDRVVVSVDSGHYAFVVDRAPPAAEAPLRTSKPADTSLNPQALDVRKMRRVQHWDFRDAGNLAAWNQRSNLRVDQRDGKAILVAIGPDPQVAVHFAPAIQGSFVVQLNANPHQGAESQFFWAGPGHGFNAQEQIKRHLNEAEQVNPYLFGGQSNQPVDRLRFDPFESFDAAANVGHMDVESISIYVPAGGQ
ncbi:MAG: family 78 glycoside hydrolase catalytic domain, partial [Planctomycetales bacterium]|nr:family 78 glycoside hydrolase catalytic domain [Planctomycetales bacterium]